MLITLFAVLVSAWIRFVFPILREADPTYLVTMMLIGGTAILFGLLFLYTIILIPFQNLEQKLIPNLMQLLQQDAPLKMGRLYLFVFTAISFLCAPIVTQFEHLEHHGFFLVWFILFAIALDILRDSWLRLIHLLTPSFVIKKISNQAEKAIQNDNSSAFLNELDNLAEIGVRSVEKSKLSLSTQILQALPPLLKIYFDSAKSIGHASRDINQTKTGEDGDASNYVVFYLLQRLELINDKALKDRQETVCRQMIMSLGKIIVYCAQFDLSLVAFPTHFLTKFGLKAQQHYFDEVSVLTTSTLLEISKTTLTEIDVTYAELQGPFQAIINGLAALAKGTFKKQKNTSIKVLIQPLVDLKALFQTEKMANHRDTPVIIQQINNVLDEFSILQEVMQTMPPIPGIEPEFQ